MEVAMATSLRIGNSISFNGALATAPRQPARQPLDPPYNGFKSLLDSVDSEAFNVLDTTKRRHWDRITSSTNGIGTNRAAEETTPATTH